MNRLPIRFFALAASFGAILSSQPADAFCRAMAHPKSGVCQQTCGSDALLYWNTRHFKWELFKNPASDTIQGLPWADVQTALKQSAETWQNVSCADVSFEFSGAVSDFKTGFEQCKTNTNRIVFRDHACTESGVVPEGDPCLTAGNCGHTYDCWDHDDSPEGPIALTTSTFDPETGEVIDADMEFNTSKAANGSYVNRFTVADGSPCPLTDQSQTNCVGTDLRNTATHEFGHFLGLTHTQSEHADATMFTSAAPNETSKRELSQDDIDGLCAIYPKGQPTAYCKAPIPDGCPTTNTKKGLFCSATGGVDLLALAALAGLVRRRRFHGKNL